MNHSISGLPAAPPLSMTGNQVIVNPVISQGFDSIVNLQSQGDHVQLPLVPSGYSPFWARFFGLPQGRRSKRPGGVFEIR